MNIWYRLSVFNDYQNSYAVVNFFKTPHIESLEAYRVGGIKDPSYSDGIHIYLNFNKIGLYKSKNEAIIVLNELISQCPKEARKEYEAYKHLLYRDLK